jgi:hypothetical protein
MFRQEVYVLINSVSSTVLLRIKLLLDNIIVDLKVASFCNTTFVPSYTMFFQA